MAFYTHRRRCCNPEGSRSIVEVLLLLLRRLELVMLARAYHQSHTLAEDDKRYMLASAKPGQHWQLAGGFRVGDSGFEPLTSSASRKRSPPELIALTLSLGPRSLSERRHPESNRGTGFCRPLPNHSAMPPRGQSGRRDSNPRPSPWQGDALPAELRPRLGIM